MLSVIVAEEEIDNVSLDRLQASLFYLMTQYSNHHCPMIAKAIVNHINYVYRHPHSDLLPEQKKMFAKLIDYWQSRLPINKTVQRKKWLN